MTILTQITPANLCEFVFALPIAQPIVADSRDYGFDFNEEELGGELLAPLPASLAIQSLPEVDVDAFHYFLS